MRRFLLTLALSLIVTSYAFAQTQSTTVTGTITDPVGNVYQNATVQAETPPNSVPTITTTNASGVFSMPLTTTVSGGTTYKFSVSTNGVLPPKGTGPQSFSTNIVISGTSQDISSALSTLAPALLSLSGGNTGLAANTPGIPTYNGPNIYYVSNYAATGKPPGKALRFFDASFTNSSPTVTVGNNPTETDTCITSSMIGWLVAGMDNASTTISNTAATSRFAAGTTITAVASCTSFTASNNSSQSCTSSSGQSKCQLIIAPYDDYPAVNAAWTAMITANGSATACNGKLVLPQGLLWLSQPSRVASNPCNASVNSNGTPTGFWIEGCGPTCTILFPAPTGNWTVGTNQGTLFYIGNGGAGMHYSNFSVDGAGQITTLGSSGYAFALGDNSSMFNIGIYQWGVQSILAGGCDACEVFLDHVSVGGTLYGPNLGAFSKSFAGDYFWCTNANCYNEIMSGTPAWSVNDSVDAMFGTGGGDGNFEVFGAEGWVSHLQVDSGPNSGPLISVASSGKLHLDHSYAFNCTPSQNAIGISVDSTSTLYSADNKVVCNSATSKGFNIAGTFIDLGQTSFASAVANTLTGNYIGQGSPSFNSTIVTAAKLVLSTGWGSTAANTSLSGGNSPIGFTITNSGTGQAASPTITYTFPTPYVTAPLSCAATQTGGTNASLNPFTSSALSATGVTFTATGTPTAASTEIMQVTCVLP